MGEKGYTVSEAVQLTGVPSHVLRYWEEELGIPVARTSQGHRIYSGTDIQTFRQVKELKAKGLQLKAIRVLIEGSGTLTGDASFREQVQSIAESREDQESRKETEEEATAVWEIIPAEQAQDPVDRFTAVLKQMLEEVVKEQNRQLEQSLADCIREELSELYTWYPQAFQEVAAAKECRPVENPEGSDRGRVHRLIRKISEQLEHIWRV